MDSRTHVEFAKKITPAQYKPAILASLFPQIDRQPAPLHRNYAHQIKKVQSLTDIGFEVIFSEGDLSHLNANDYVIKRFKEEKERIKAYEPGISHPGNFGPDLRRAAQIAYVSHLYLDIFNQPVQAFVPFKSNCAGMFDMWDKVGDFRYRLYVENVVADLRKEWLQSKIWNTTFNGEDYLKAMITRLTTLCGLTIDSDPVKKAASELNVNLKDTSRETLQWFEELEHELSNLHIKYLG